MSDRSNIQLDELWESITLGNMNRRDVLKRALALGLSAPVIAGLLAACGGDDDDDDDDEGSGDADPTATSDSGGGDEEPTATEAPPLRARTPTRPRQLKPRRWSRRRPKVKRKSRRQPKSRPNRWLAAAAARSRCSTGKRRRS
ncbi:MAG: hypothetical protein R2849_05900 [Thermomicrobiales bacterium]